MKHGAILLLILAAAVSILAVLTFRAGNIREDISKVELATLSVLRANDITEGDIISREEDEWVRSGIQGKTLDYVFSSGGAFNVSEFGDQLKKELEKIKGVHLDRVSYYGGEDQTGTARFDITRVREVILSVTIKDVLPLGVKSREKEVRDVDKKVPVPSVALVLDDFGYTKKNLDALKKVGVPLTIAVLPNTPYAKTVCSFAKKNGIEVILHLPMEPKDETAYLEVDTIDAEMDAQTLKKVIANAFDSVYSAKGVSNHMGSKATMDTCLMELVLEDIKTRDMFFLDSVTTEGSVCAQAARKFGVPYVKRDIFIDNELNREYIERQMEKVERMALSNGNAVAIGHDRGMTIDVLRDVVPRMKERGIQFVRLSEIVKGEGAK
ncbi:MAG: divergent polysaccharide deacetylase family protein [Candidatus Omnitrophota bacterium]